MDLDLKFIGDENLTQPSETISNIDTSIKELVSSMKAKMVECNGIGLAAPQVGHNIRLMVVKLGSGQIVELINPRISWTSESRVKIEEGCLSIPGKLIWIDRPDKVRVKFQTTEGEFKYWSLSGMDARVFLHEYDHLEGILMTERL